MELEEVIKYWLFLVALLMSLVAVLFLSVLLCAPRESAQCRGGYKFLVGSHNCVQILDDQGHGIKCEANQ